MGWEREEGQIEEEGGWVHMTVNSTVAWLNAKNEKQR